MNDVAQREVKFPGSSQGVREALFRQLCVLEDFRKDTTSNNAEKLDLILATLEVLIRIQLGGVHNMITKREGGQIAKPTIVMPHGFDPRRGG